MVGIMTYTSLVTAVNLVLLAVLFITYLQNYLKMKVNFALGLLLFSAVFIIQKLVSLYLFLFTMPEFESTVGISMFVLESIELFAFSIIVWITVR